MSYHPYHSGQNNDHIFNLCNPTYNLEGFDNGNTCSQWQVVDKYKNRASDDWCQLGCHRTDGGKPAGYCKGTVNATNDIWCECKTSGGDPASTPTQAPPSTPTQAPSQNPTQAPSQNPTQAPSQNPTQGPTLPIGNTSVAAIKKLFDDAGVKNMQTISDSCGGGDPGMTVSANIWKGYSLDDFWQTLDLVTKINPPIYLGENAIEGAVIVSGMMGNFFVEGYNFQICDESNWKNDCQHGPCGCGQFGHDYTSGAGYVVPPACPLDKTMNINAADNGNNAKWAKGQMECTAGTASAGCCWWGRGPTQLTGRHNIKVLDDWLTKNSQVLGSAKSTLCANPGLICQPNAKTTKGGSLVWLSSLGYWIWSVQANDNYLPELHKFMSEYRNGKFPSLKTSDLINSSPASWPSGIGGAINNGVWSNQAQDNIGRVCGFLRMLKLLKLMPATQGQNAPNCNINKF